MTLVYEGLEERHLDALTAISAYCFNSPVAEIGPWWEKAGLGNIRVVRDGDTVLGGAILISMGQFFVGRRLPMCGIAGVVVGPEVRGRGVARFLMGEVLREARAAHPVSSLYASTVPLYRSLGYERAGGIHFARCPTRALPRGSHECSVRAMEPDDFATVARLRTERVASIHGALDNGDYMWHRLRTPRVGESKGFVFEGPGGPDGPGGPGSIEGHAWVNYPAHFTYERFHLTDWSATTPRAFRTLLAWLGSHSTVQEELEFVTEPRDPLLLALPDRHYSVRCPEHWLLRILDVPAALTGRGYAAGAATTLELDVQDGALADNAGPWTLRLEDGRAAAERGGAGRIRLSARGLAALYAGMATAEGLALQGLCEAAPADLARATAAFSAPAPAMLQRF